MYAESSMTSENYVSEEKNDYKTDTEESDDVSMEQYPPLCMWVLTSNVFILNVDFFIFDVDYDYFWCWLFLF